MKEINLTIYDHNIWGSMPKNESISNRNSLVTELISYYDADICAFQECNPKTSRAGDANISLLLSNEYKEVYTEVNDNNFTPIFYKESRFDVIDSGFHIYEGLNDLNSKSITYAVFEEKENGVKFGVISTHFWWKHDSDADNIQRIENAKTLLRYVDDLKNKYDIPVFAMGDLNCGTNSAQGTEPYLYLRERLLDLREVAPISTDVFTHHDCPKKDADGIYNTSNGRVESVRNLDYIFVTKHKNVAIDSFAIDTSDEAYASSDHYPLIAEVRVFGE